MNLEIYTQSYCPFCRAALELLEAAGIDFVHHQMDGKDAELNDAKRQHNHPTIPIVLVDGQLIGGYQELMALEASGKLQQS